MLDRTLAHAKRLYPGRTDLALRIALIVDAESDNRVLANSGAATALSVAQKAALLASVDVLAEMGWPKEWVGKDGVSVGPTQASPSEATTIAAKPWRGWGTIRQCMDIDYIIPETLRQLISSNHGPHRAGLLAGAALVGTRSGRRPDSLRGGAADRELRPACVHRPVPRAGLVRPVVHERRQMTDPLVRVIFGWQGSAGGAAPVTPGSHS